MVSHRLSSVSEIGKLDKQCTIPSLKEFAYPGPCLGQGSYKVVHMAKRWENGELVAIGRIEKKFVKNHGLEEELARVRKAKAHLAG